MDSRVKENPAHSPIVDGLSQVGPVLSRVLLEEQRGLKELSPTQMGEWKAENERYDVFWGRRYEWVRYINDPKAEGLWKMAPAGEAKGFMGVLCVCRAKDGELRKILAVVAFNSRLRTPKELLSADDEALGMLCPSALAGVAAPSGTCYWSALDEPHAFASVVAPPPLGGLRGCVGLSRTVTS